MASHKSALKRIKQTQKRTELNRAHLTRLRHQIRKFRAALKAKDKAAAEALLKPTLGLIITPFTRASCTGTPRRHINRD